jgi:hypothetical protein
VAQDFWASSGFTLLERRDEGVAATPAWLARFTTRPELEPPAEALAGERALHARLAADPLAPVPAGALGRVDDADAR